ncbi:hypothetical protein VP1G_10612 [Cytospora mali]|uniref:Uncharacterized protein n=1 Tax=Cytospora mali TaxID=578113 RepID=A0A194UQZ3_CYTMA|nr:hypothetical protein VP1G_10612 [Valsa mali var. pyri (nom. inval.)]
MALSATWYELVLEVDLVVQERHNETGGRTARAAHLPLPLGASVDAHGLAVSVPVHLANGVQALLQRLAIGREAAHRQDQRRVVLVCRATANLEHLGVVSRVDAVAGCVSGVASHDGKVSASDGEDGAAVVGVTEKY